MSQQLRQNEIAHRYGGVLFDLAQEKVVLEKTLNDVRRLLGCLHHDHHVWRFIASPVISLTLQAKILNTIGKALQLDNLTTRFLLLVGQNHRLLHLELMLEEFITRCKGVEGVIEGTLETATAVPVDSLKKLEEVLAKSLGKKVVLDSSVRKSLLGGVVLRIGSFVVDASIKTRLNKLRDKMKE